MSKVSYKQRNETRRNRVIRENEASRLQRTNKQQLAKLDAEGWTAVKERARLAK